MPPIAAPQRSYRGKARALAYRPRTGRGTIEQDHFERPAIIAVLTIATVAGCVPALQPLLLGGLLSEGKIDAASLGYAATAEGLGMALAIAIASARLPARRLRAIAGGAILAVMIANLLTIFLSAPGIIAARGISGVGNGLLLWILAGLVIRTENPARLFAIFVTAQAVLGFVLSMVLATYALARFGVLSGYAGLMVLDMLLLPLLLFVPRAYADLEQGDGAAGMPSLWGLIALGAIVLQFAGMMAFWIYSIPLGNQSGISTSSVQKMIGAANGAQILGGLAATALATRMTAMQAMTGTATLSIGAMFATLASGSETIWLTAMLVFAFCWMFVPAFYIPFVLIADPTRKSAMYIGTAQLLGITAGPLLAAMVVSSSDYRPSPLTAIACFGAALLTAILVFQNARGQRTSL